MEGKSLKGRPYEDEVGEVSKFKQFFYLLLQSIASSSLLHHKIRIFLYRRMGMEIGENVYIGSGLKISDPINAKYIKIGDRVSIAPDVYLAITSGPNNSKLKNEYSRVIGEINIEQDAWIGAKSIILPGIKLGKKSVVGAGTVVTENVEDNTVVAGKPADEIKKVNLQN